MEGLYVYATRGREEGVANGTKTPQGCLPDHPCGIGAPLPAIFSSTVMRMDTVPVSPVRALHRTLCAYKDDKALSSILVAVGDPPINLSR